MEFNELIADFAKRHSVENLAAEEGTAALDIDGIVTTLVESGEEMTISAEIGEAPAEGKAAFADLLLAANLESPAFFAKTQESDQYVLVQRLQLAGIDGEAFDLTLEDFVNRVETWRKLIVDYRPVAEAAAEQESQDVSFSLPGFMQV